MSTLCKLDPTVRRARYARRDSLRGLAQVVSKLVGLQQIRAAFYLDVLAEVKRAPNLTGHQKNVEFAKVIKRITQENQNGHGHQAIG